MEESKILLSGDWNVHVLASLVAAVRSLAVVVELR